MWTTMIALVLGVMRASMSAARMFQVSGSQSTQTGVAPARTTAAAQEMMVKLGMITSSPGPMPSAATASSRAAEPLLTATPNFLPTFAANCSSKRPTKGPSDEIQPSRMHSSRYFFSFPSSRTLLTGTFITFMPAASGLEARLVMVAAVGPLLDLEHFQLGQHLESMAALDQQDRVPVRQFARGEQHAVLAVEIHPQPALLDEQHLAGVLHRTGDGIVDVRRNLPALGMPHVGQLLRVRGRREEMDAGFLEPGVHDDGEDFTAVLDVLDHQPLTPRRFSEPCRKRLNFCEALAGAAA